MSNKIARTLANPIWKTFIKPAIRCCHGASEVGRLGTLRATQQNTKSGPRVKPESQCQMAKPKSIARVTQSINPSQSKVIRVRQV